MRVGEIPTRRVRLSHTSESGHICLQTKAGPPTIAPSLKHNGSIKRSSTVNVTETIEEIREANLSYLMLAQQMLREDKEAAMFRLGISDELAETMLALSNSQVLKMASSNMLLFRFRFDDRLVLGMLNGY